MLLLVWHIKQYLKHSTAFVILSPKVHITPNTYMVRPVTAIFQSIVWNSALVGVFISVKREHNYSNSFEEKHVIWVACLELQRFSLLLSWWGSWQHGGRHSAGGGENPTSWRQHRKSTVILVIILNLGNLKACPHSDTLPRKWTYTPQQTHISQ